MRCERLIKAALVFIVLLAACRRETPSTTETQPVTPEPSGISTAAGPPPAKTYDDAVTWFRSTPGFHFVVEEGGVRAEGEVTRARVGAEKVEATVNGGRWSAETSSKGIVWRRGGKETEAPQWGNRLYQRVTVAFDPEKREGEAELVEPGHYRFTDANSGAVHDVWINEAGQITRMTIGDTVSMVITNHR
jgi:hypothetical protein